MGNLSDQLVTIIKQIAQGRPPAKSLNAILMKFAKVESGFEECRTVFKSFDADNSGTIELAEMKSAVGKLGMTFDDAKVQEIFQIADFDNNSHISFKEFIVALTILQLLDGEKCGGNAAFTAAIEVVIDAFMFFDKNSDGVIEQDEVMQTLAGNAGSNEMNNRMKELDWDSNGKVTFVEFLHAFEEWVGVEETDE